MSRSRKTIPVCTDRNPFMKNYANRRIRRKPVSHVIASGGNYKKETCSWDICDYKFFYFNPFDHKEYCDRHNELPYKAIMK